MTTRIYVGVAAAVMLACAPTVAQENAEAPAASVVNETTAPTAAAMMKTEESATETPDAEATSAAATPGDPVVCKRGKTERHVNVVSPDSGERVCEVHYAKPTEGVENRVLWYATSDKNFCDERANNLMSRLTSAGFTCTNSDGTPVSIEASATPEPAAETVSAPESGPQNFEPDTPAEPMEPADAPEGADEPADEPAEEDDQEN